MKHAGQGCLDQIEALLQSLRAIPGPIEKKRGIFYYRGKAFLHFHEDPKGLFADIRSADGSRFERIDVTDTSAQIALPDQTIRRLRELGPGPKPQGPSAR